MTQLFYPNFTQAPCIPVKFLYNRNILCRFPAKIPQTIPSGALTGLNPPRHPLEAPSPTPSASRPRNFFPISSYQHPGRLIPQSSYAQPTAPRSSNPTRNRWPAAVLFQRYRPLALPVNQALSSTNKKPLESLLPTLTSLKAAPFMSPSATRRYPAPSIAARTSRSESAL